MDKKMTSGEIAKKAGVSQKAVRLYDEKGLLKPADYSEGNYRLYDKASLQVLEKIVALKAIGFSLEEIRDNLTAGQASDVSEALRLQLKNMEEKRRQIDNVIAAINGALERKGSELDWDDVASIVQSISIDQKADEHHLDALKHTQQEPDWYVKIFDSLKIKKREKVLDLGCGYAKLWRNNWERIPEGTKICAVDVHGSWADDFDKYLAENKDGLPKGVKFSLLFEDLETDAAWEKIAENKGYDLIIAHYLGYELKDPEAMIEKASGMLSDKGMFSYNGPGADRWHIFARDTFHALGIKADFVEERIAEEKKKSDECRQMLMKYFEKIEMCDVYNKWHYTDAAELFDKLRGLYEDQEKFINLKREKLTEFFETKIETDGEIVIETAAHFWHCRK
ncbi:MAG: MerR family transcriptional regulator [Lachnospiraceae bacterium]|nr:MerR family transcriptional regulator [Lachnospiraceae bacterium]